MEKIRKMHVEKVMEKKVPVLKPGDSIKKAAKILVSQTLDMLPVEDEQGRFVGEVSTSDLLKLVIDPKDMSSHDIMMEPLVGMSFYPRDVGEIMRRHRCSLKPDDTIAHAARLMYKHRATVLPVLEKGKMVGLLFQDDIVKLLARV